VASSLEVWAVAGQAEDRKPHERPEYANSIPSHGRSMMRALAEEVPIESEEGTQND
jgi:hypothetical protein